MSAMSAKRIKLDDGASGGGGGDGGDGGGGGGDEADDGPTLADVWRPNLHKLYELAVQDGSEIDVMTKCFAELRGDMSPPLSLREDFCGTHLLCRQWVGMGSTHTAFGLDNDQPTLDWGLEQAEATLDASE